jgi:hypothetical protein
VIKLMLWFVIDTLRNNNKREAVTEYHCSVKMPSLFSQKEDFVINEKIDLFHGYISGYLTLIRKVW